MKNKLFLMMFFMVLNLFVGCASTKRNDITYDNNRQYIESGVIGLKKSDSVLAISSNINVRGKSEGAISGLANGLGVCFSPGGGGGADGAVVGLLIRLICLPFAVTIGPVTGLIGAEYESVLEQKESNIIQETSRLNAQDTVHAIALEYATSYGLKMVPFESETTVPYTTVPYKNDNTLFMKDRNVGTVMEISVTDISIDGEGWKDVPFRLTVKGNATLKDANSNQLLDSMDIIYYTLRRNYSVWVDNDLSLLKEEMENSLHYIVEQAVDELLLIYHHKEDEDSDNLNWSKMVSSQVIAPIYPTSTFHFNPLEIFSKEYVGAENQRDFRDVNEDHPTFKWIALPPALESINDKLSSIYYDFRIYEAEYQEEPKDLYYPSKIVYSKNNIVDTKYKVDNSLNLCGRYFWTVRGRFILNGYPRVTEWSRDRRGTTPWALRRHGDLYDYLNTQFFHTFKVTDCD